MNEIIRMGIWISKQTNITNFTCKICNHKHDQHTSELNFFNQDNSDVNKKYCTSCPLNANIKGECTSCKHYVNEGYCYVKDQKQQCKCDHWLLLRDISKMCSCNQCQCEICK